MAKHYPFLQGFSFALANFRKNDLLYWSFWLTVVNIAGAIVEKVSGYSFWNYIMTNLGKPNADISYLLISWLITFAVLLVSMYVSARAMMSAMKISKVKTAKGIDFLKWVWLQIYKLLLNAVCWYDKKLLLPAIGLGALAAAVYFAVPGDFAFIIAFPVFFLAVLAWDAAFLIHVVRTSFSVYMFLEGEKSAGKVVRNSDKLVKGQTVEVFAAQLLAMLALLIPLLIINFATGEAVGKIGAGIKAYAMGGIAGAGGEFAIAAIGIVFVAVLSVFTLALQQAISANIWAFFGKRHNII